MAEKNNNLIMVDQVKNDIKTHILEGGSCPAEYDERDIKRLMDDPENRWLEQFVKANKDVKSTMANIKTSLKWRKEFGANDIQYSDVSEDVWKLGWFYLRHTGKSGHAICWNNGGQSDLLKKLGSEKPDLDLLLMLQKDIVYSVEKVLRKDPGAQIILAVDVSQNNSATIDKLGLNIGKFIISSLGTYYPNVVHKCLLYKPPTLFHIVLKIFYAFLSKELKDMINIVKQDQMTEFIEPQYLPAHMGGTDTTWCKNITE